MAPIKIGIVGGGFVGSATALLKCHDIDIIIYDLNPDRCSPKGTTVTDLLDCAFVFVCVPTPSYETGECNTIIVRKCIEGLHKQGVHNIVLRSTVPPGTSEGLDVNFMPEFLTEANWPTDFYNCSTWIFAGKSQQDCEQFQKLMTLAKENGVISSDNIIFTTSKEAELIKYTRNNFLATKVSFFNEIYSICKKIGVDYEMVRKGVCADERIGTNHSRIPGYDGHYGYGGTCLPKDTNALLYFMKSNSLESYIIQAIVDRNIKIDRPECDWKDDPRAFTKKE